MIARVLRQNLPQIEQLLRASGCLYDIRAEERFDGVAPDHVLAFPHCGQERLFAFALLSAKCQMIVSLEEVEMPSTGAAVFSDLATALAECDRIGGARGSAARVVLVPDRGYLVRTGSSRAGRLNQDGGWR